MFFLTLTIYDSLIIAAAKAEGCDVVYNKDHCFDDKRLRKGNYSRKQKAFSFETRLT